VDVQQAGDSLTIQNQVSVGTTTIGTVKNGAGKLFMKNVRMPLTINAGSVSILTDGGDAATSNISTLSIAGARQGGPTATLDLNNNDLLVGNNSYGNIASLVAAARNGGSWDQPGITSTAARGPGATMLGVVTGAEYTSAGGGPLFSGQPFLPGDVLVKYTWYGDSDLNGEVNFDDYVRLDNGYNSSATGWFNGDFNYSSSIDFDDYVLIDLGFNAQSGTLRRAQAFLASDDRSMSGMDAPALHMVARNVERFGAAYARSFLAAVPEPIGGVVWLVGLTALRRRRMAP
jgi:hypothetical protein